MPDQDQFVQLTFPKGGIDNVCAFGRQTARQAATGDWVKTTPSGFNVRTYDPDQDRIRGGSRPGLSRYISSQLAGIPWVVQDLTHFAGQILGGGMQVNSSGRVVTIIAVSQGNVYYAVAGASSWTAATNNATPNPPLNFTGVVRSAINNQLCFFADGVHEVFFRASDGTVNNWVASAGTLPKDSSDNRPRLICTWRGRTVLSGLLLDPQDWFMSAVNDPDDWDYSPLSTTPTQAIAGNNAPQGLVGDVITALIPYTDDILIFGGDHTIYMMNGDPLAGGQIDLISDQIGMAWGNPWVKDPLGNLYFFSNKCGIYTLVPGQAPQRISQAIENIVQDIDTGENTIRMFWNDRFQGVHVFITPTSQAADTTHLFYEVRTSSWWQDTFANKKHNPLCGITFDGNTPNDRVVLLGSWDGYVRAVDFEATTDDGWPISSSVVIGPMLTERFDEMLLKELQAVMAKDANAVTFSVYVGATAEIALASTPVLTGTWKAGRNLTNLIRRAGHAIYVKISGLSPWAIEGIRAKLTTTGKVRMRGF